jgi:hypothetical protein
MIPGFNHSIKHRGSVYHVQTEDLGLHNPFISTHLFLGGNVLATRRTSYAELANVAGAEPRVRKLMQDQHKEMLRQLIRGAFDREGAAAAPLAYQPGQLAPETAPRPGSASPTVIRAAATAAAGGAPASGRPSRPAVAEADPPVLSRGLRPPAPPVRAPTPPPVVVIPEIEDEDLMSDRRLDEVILAYLADFPGPGRG